MCLILSLVYWNSIYLNCSLWDKVNSSRVHVLTLALNDYSRATFNHLRIVTPYICCGLGLHPKVLSQVAGWLWPEVTVRSISWSSSEASLLLQDEVLYPWFWGPPA